MTPVAWAILIIAGIIIAILGMMVAGFYLIARDLNRAFTDVLKKHRG